VLFSMKIQCSFLIVFRYFQWMYRCNHLPSGLKRRKNC